MRWSFDALAGVDLIRSARSAPCVHGQGEFADTEFTRCLGSCGLAKLCGRTSKGCTMPNRARRRWYQAIVAMGGLAAVAVVVPCLVVAAATPPAGSDHAEVVAQRLLQLDGGEVQWSASMMDITAATTLSSDRPTFVAVAGGSPLMIEGSDGVDVILDAGEAVFRPSAATSESSALAGGPSHAAVLGLGAPGSDGAVGDRFVPGAGAHDVELLHDTLAPGETLTLGGGLPVLLFVADGAVTARADGSVSHSGAVEVVPGDVTITNGADWRRACSSAPSARRSIRPARRPRARRPT